MSKILMAVLVLMTANVYAADEFLTLNVAAYHFDRKAAKYFNETNSGIGYEKEDGNMRTMTGMYRNSLYATSFYALKAYTPIHIGKTSIGVFGGGVTGYIMKISPAIGVLITYQASNNIGINLTVVPTVRAQHIKVYGFSAIQLRYKL